MKLNGRYALIFAALSLALNSPAQTSTFDEGDEGWTEFNNGGQAIQWLASGGNPGGGVRLSDIAAGSASFEAPLKFLGNQSNNCGRCFEYDIFSENAGLALPGALELVGGTNLTLLFPLSSQFQGQQWHTFTVPLFAARGWVIAGGANATEAQLRYVLSDLTHLRIDGDLFNSNDSTRLDNVSFVQCPEMFIRLSQVEVCWTSRTNRLYDIEYSSALTTNTWVNLLTNVVGNGATNCITDAIPPGEPQRYYRTVEHR